MVAAIFEKLISESEESKMDEVLAKIGSDLDGRFSSARTSESNLGNLMAEVALAALQVIIINEYV